MSTSAHQMAITAKDKTAGAFQSVQARAAAAASRVAAVMGAAIAAAGAYLSVRALKGAVDELGKLSDLAMKSGTSVEALTKTSKAFQIAGLDIGVEQLAKSFQYLKKTTGEGGIDNFFATAEAISKIEDPAKRGAELVRNFGRAGLELQPLIDGGSEAIEKMKALAGVMPGVSTAAANAGDEAADAISTFLGRMKVAFLNVVGRIISYFVGDFPGGIRAGARLAAEYVITFAKQTLATIVHWSKNIAATLGWVKNVFTEGFSGANEIWKEQTDESLREYEERMARYDKNLEAFKAKLAEANKAGAFNPFGDGKGFRKGGAEEGGAGAAPPRITNDLVMAGSNAALRMTILGPTYQNEQRKQTALLEKIAKNTEATAENTDGENYEATSLGA